MSIAFCVVVIIVEKCWTTPTALLYHTIYYYRNTRHAIDKSNNQGLNLGEEAATPPGFCCPSGCW